MVQSRNGQYPKNSFGGLVGQLVEALFVIQLVVQFVGYCNLNLRQFLIDKLSQNIETILGQFWKFWELLCNFRQFWVILLGFRAISGGF